MKNPDRPIGGNRSVERGLGPVDEDRDVGPDRSAGIQDVVAQAGLLEEEIPQSFLHCLTFDFDVAVTGHSMLEHPREPDNRTH